MDPSSSSSPLIPTGMLFWKFSDMVAHSPLTPPHPIFLIPYPTYTPQLPTLSQRIPQPSRPRILHYTMNQLPILPTRPTTLNPQPFHKVNLIPFPNKTHSHHIEHSPQPIPRSPYPLPSDFLPSTFSPLTLLPKPSTLSPLTFSPVPSPL